MKKKYKIYFIEPNFAQIERPSFDEFMEPLNLCYLASAALNEGHKVIVKQQFNLTIEAVVNDIIDYNPDILAITLVTYYFNNAKRLISEVKKRKSDITTISGGSHATGDPEECARFFDFVIIGEGETPFIRLLDELPFNKTPDIGGVGYYSGEEFHINNTKVRDRKIIGMPYRGSLNMSKYTGIGNGPPPMPKVSFASMLLSKGCRFDCDFCINKLMWKETGLRTIPVIKRDQKDVINEMEYLHSGFNIGYIWFQDADFPLYDRNYFKSFFNIKRPFPQIKYSFMTRIDNIILRNNVSEAKSFLKELKSSGCHMIGFGIESFSPELLKQMKKEVSIRKVETTLELVFKAGIIPVAFFIIGYPNETIESIEATYKIAKKLNIIRFRFAIFYPFKGTTRRENIYSNDWLIKETDSYDFANNEHQVVKCKIPDKEIDNYFKRMNSEIYFEKEYLLNLDQFYSMHADMRPTIDNWRNIIERV